MIISRTPFRISFFGGGTDFPDFFREHSGAALSTTINKYCYTLIHRLSPFFKHRFRASYSRTELVQTPSEFAHPLIRECLLYLNIEAGLEISHISDLPGRTGLGTSSAFTVGLLNALHTLRGDRMTAEDLAREAILIERDRVGDPGGHQDQYAAAYGGLNRYDFTTHQGVTVKRLTLPSERIRALEDHLLMFYTGMEQSADDTLKEQQSKINQNNLTLMAMLKMVDEAEEILARDVNLDTFGRLLHEAWKMKKSLSSGISNSMINDAYTAAHNAGALGGKLLGAGGRGFLLLYADPMRHAGIRETLKGLLEVNVQFEPEGSRIIFQAPE